MRASHPPKGQAFFARSFAGIFECPRCGVILTYNCLGGRKGSRLGNSNANYNPRTSQFWCPECDCSGIIGTLVWPVKVGGRGQRTRPRDQVPNVDQWAQLRARGDGLWLNEKAHRKPAFRPANTNITAECTCPPGTENTDAGDPNCLIHGDSIKPVEFYEPKDEDT